MTALSRVLPAVLLLGLSAGAAPASPAVLIADAPLHEQPGADQAVVGKLSAGAHVDVRHCQGTKWCLVDRRGKSGWVGIEALDLYPGLTGIDTPAEAAAASSAQTDRARRLAADAGGGKGADNPFAARQRDSLSRKEPAALPGAISPQGSYEDLVGKAAPGEAAALAGSTRKP